MTSIWVVHLSPQYSHVALVSEHSRLKVWNLTSANTRGRTNVRIDDSVTTKFSWMHRWPNSRDYHSLGLLMVSRCACFTSAPVSTQISATIAEFSLSSALFKRTWPLFSSPNLPLAGWRVKRKHSCHVEKEKKKDKELFPLSILLCALTITDFMTFSLEIPGEASEVNSKRATVALSNQT